jgi:hypothetical protein
MIQAVYSPTDEMGRGQGTRAKWFVSAVQNRYSHKLSKIQQDVSAFRIFISEMEEVVEMRDILNGEGYTISFESAFLLWELGMDADSVMGTIQEVCANLKFQSQAAKFVVRAAQMVKAGYFMEIETAIESMRYGYEYDPTESN